MPWCICLLKCPPNVNLFSFQNSFIDNNKNTTLSYVLWCLCLSPIRLVFLPADLRMSLCSFKTQFLLLFTMQSTFCTDQVISSKQKQSPKNAYIRTCMLSWTDLHTFLVIYHFHILLRCIVYYIFPGFPLSHLFTHLSYDLAYLFLHSSFIHQPFHPLVPPSLHPALYPSIHPPVHHRVHKSHVRQGLSQYQAPCQALDHKDEEKMFYTFRKLSETTI